LEKGHLSPNEKRLLGLQNPKRQLPKRRVDPKMRSLTHPLTKVQRKMMTPKQKYRIPWNLRELGTTKLKIPKVMTLRVYLISMMTSIPRSHPWRSCVRRGE
jgi:hypothetical protein